MSGLIDLNFPAFHAEAARLRALGYDVVNPAEINVDPPGWQNAMRKDIAALLTCDVIAMLPGWEGSRGANLEWLIATELGMPVLTATWIGFDGVSAELPTEASIQIRAHHWANTATGLRLARAENRAEAARAHELATKFLRMAVEAGVRGGVQ